MEEEGGDADKRITFDEDLILLYWLNGRKSVKRSSVLIAGVATFYAVCVCVWTTVLECEQVKSIRDKSEMAGNGRGNGSNRSAVSLLDRTPNAAGQRNLIKFLFHESLSMFAPEQIKTGNTMPPNLVQRTYASNQWHNSIQSSNEILLMHRNRQKCETHRHLGGSVRVGPRSAAEKCCPPLTLHLRNYLAIEETEKRCNAQALWRRQ